MSAKARGKHFKEQFEDEEVLLVFRKHPIVMRKGLIWWALSLLLGVSVALVRPTFGYFFGGLGAGFILGCLLLLPYWIRWYFSIYIMTNHRFIQQTRSIFQLNVVDISLEQVQMINYQVSGVEQTLLGFGTIMVQTYVGDLVIKDVAHPAKIQSKMVGLLRELGIHPSTRPTTDTASDT